MAETAGLVLGGVALAGLVSTCVEIVEYFESAKNRTGDFRLALTKVNLVKQRLRAWGAALPVNMPPDPRSNHTFAPTGCGVLIEETLTDIRRLLDKTNEMSKRHGLRGPSHRWDLSGAGFETPRPRLPRILLSFQLKFIWVFQDRKRFDDVIAQLDFLLSNLEKISETPQGRSQMPQDDSKQCPPFSKVNGVNHIKPEEEEEDSSHRSAEVDNMDVDADEDDKGPLVGVVSKYSGQLIQTHLCHDQFDHASSDTAALSKQLHPGGAELPSPPQSDEQSENRQDAQGKSLIHKFSQNYSYQDSSNFLGDLNDTGVAQQGVRGHDFTQNISHNTSLMLQGSVSTNFAAELMKIKGADRRKEKVAEIKAAAASSARGIKK